MIFLHALRSAEKKTPENLSQYEIRVVCACAFANVLPTPFRKRQMRLTGRRCEASLLTKTIMHPTREQRRLVLFFGSSSCAGFTIVTVHTHITHYFFSMKRRSLLQKRNEARGANETQRRLVSFLCSFTPPPSLSCFLYTFFTSLSSFQPGPENEPSTTKVDKEGEQRDTEKVSFKLLCSFTLPPSLSCFLYTFSPHFHRFSLDLRTSQAPQRWTRKGSNKTQRLVLLLCLFTPPPSLSCLLYTFSPHFHHFSLDLRMSQAPQRWTRKGSNETQKLVSSCCARSPHLPHFLVSCTHFHLTFVVSAWT